LLGDFFLLVLTFFIAIVIVQYLKIIDSEKPMEIRADAYFRTSEYILDQHKHSKLRGVIEDSIFSEIQKYFDAGRLQRIQIEGHTDNVPPTRQLNQVRVWSTNRELSLFRANTVCSIIEEIATERLSPDRLAEFKAKLFPGGYGEFLPKGPNDTEKNRAKNRRIEIRMVIK
jgi:flagellar motor protein MotB|tara:strand:- start:1731 stop:2243 length:513 start_codon:yes stop_codon:yes gene_type:complete